MPMIPAINAIDDRPSPRLNGDEAGREMIFDKEEKRQLLLEYFHIPHYFIVMMKFK
jgi:hypothetical protein